MTSLQYTQEYEDVVSSGSYRQRTWRGKRGELTRRFAWAVPNCRAVNLLVQDSETEPIVEVGAGTGYWAYEINRRGGNIIPIDIEEYEETWTDVIIGSYHALNPSSVSRLFLCWPPANSSMAADCLEYLGPDYLYFAGKLDSSVTGNQAFHDMLDKRYTVRKKVNIPSWNESNEVYLRKLVSN